MAIKKQFLKSKPVCKVTFTVPAAEAKQVTVAGNWNEWNTEAAPLKKLKNGTFKGTVNLEAGQAYEFKYVVDGQWQNDVEADAYAWNDYAAADNSVIKL
ncbi:isoamylase early set domain-containing protein [Olleya sp. HaHaR_3_96]|uniref:isoamylase early set domain-containing protein n=1 Tax=Olleya sp. HaHaR_3_96 TaxID=2745560 RepID=UPI001C4EB7A5|nr:isoamylase early set domain-containing protein [Olleya sp. HaHaR_3_96]QXP61255.1 isoamylase early set domain-containing protein [Olleya sp. HaHaR_3_96]